MSEAPRRQFTLANLMVVIAVVGLSIGLVIQAIGVQRYSHRPRITCLNNQRQLGLALQGYLNARGHFPNSVTWGEPAGAAIAGTIILNYERNDLSPPPGASHPDHDVGPLHGWVVDILAHMDQQALDNDFDRTRAWDSTATDPNTGVSNALISSVDIGILTCPGDDTTILGEGNLSYVVNSGFNLWWYGASGWDGAAKPPRADRTGPIDWGHAAGKRSGLMWPGTREGDRPWDHKTRITSVTDGMSTTVLLTENLHAGASDPATNPYADGRLTGWACGHPNFVAFMASDDVCTGGPGGRCSTATDLSMTTAPDGTPQVGPGWGRANAPRSPERINAALGTGIEGGSPFPSSNHPGVIVVTMCDGSVRAISESIDGAVWSQLITPAGQSLPLPYRQPTPLALPLGGP